MGCAIGSELALHLFPKILIDDRVVFPGIDLFAVADLTGINRIGEQLIEMAVGEREAALHLRRVVRAAFCDQSKPICF